MKEKLLGYWNKLDKNAKLFACAVIVIVVAGMILK